MAKVRLITLTFEDGTAVAGLLPFVLGDERMSSLTAGDVVVDFSKASDIPDDAPVGQLLESVRGVVG